MALEVGYERMDNGVLHVACRTDMHECSGAMFEWWFRFRPDTQLYTWWHPVDHISSEWLEGRDGTHVGSIHKVEESFTGTPAKKILIQFRDPAELFSPDALAAAQSSGHVSAVVCARGGESWNAPRDTQGRMIGTRMVHVARDTPWGCALRSHFFLGYDLPSLGTSSAEMKAIIPDVAAPALLAHCYNEFTFLSRFLPSLYLAENRYLQQVKLPW